MEHSDMNPFQNIKPGTIFHFRDDTCQIYDCKDGE